MAPPAPPASFPTTATDTSTDVALKPFQKPRGRRQSREPGWRPALRDTDPVGAYQMQTFTAPLVSRLVLYQFLFPKAFTILFLHFNAAVCS